MAPEPPIRPNERVTLADVASHAGVALSTASLAFSDSKRIAAPTRQRVLDAAAALAYRGPDPAAAALRTGRSGIVGGIVGEQLRYAFGDPVAARVLHGLSETLGPTGAALLLIAEPVEPDRPHPLANYRGPMDAAVIISCALDDDPVLETLRRRNIPVVAIGGPRRDEFSFVGIDERNGSARLAEHVLELGHHNVVVLSTPLRPDGTAGFVTPERLATPTYLDVTERLLGTQSVFPNHRTFEAPQNSIAAGIAAGHALLDNPDERPTAIICHSDLLAVGVIRAANELELDVPGDVSVAGFDGIDSTFTDDAHLTTVVQPAVQKGEAAGRALIDHLEAGPVHTPDLATTLRIGTSTASPSTA